MTATRPDAELFSSWTTCEKGMVLYSFTGGEGGGMPVAGLSCTRQEICTAQRSAEAFFLGAGVVFTFTPKYKKCFEARWISMILDRTFLHVFN